MLSVEAMESDTYYTLPILIYTAALHIKHTICLIGCCVSKPSLVIAVRLQHTLCYYYLYLFHYTPLTYFNHFNVQRDEQQPEALELHRRIIESLPHGMKDKLYKGNCNPEVR